MDDTEDRADELFGTNEFNAGPRRQQVEQSFYVRGGKINNLGLDGSRTYAPTFFNRNNKLALTNFTPRKEISQKMNVSKDMSEVDEESKADDSSKNTTGASLLNDSLRQEFVYIKYITDDPT